MASSRVDICAGISPWDADQQRLMPTIAYLGKVGVPIAGKSPEELIKAEAIMLDYEAPEATKTALRAGIKLEIAVLSAQGQ